jgi:putative CocE/NonD family hydrolase
MDIWITANNHGHSVGADPLRPADTEPNPSVEEQFEINRAFVARALRGAPIVRNIHYYVMGAGTFKQTDVWPPTGAQPEFLALQLSGERGGALVRRAPPRASSQRHVVDFTATTGKATRWTTQFGTPPAYADRRDEDRKLAVFDSEPVAEDSELAGTPVVTLHLAAETRDPAVFVYLEDVAPDGRVTYLTEGQLRAMHRKPAAVVDLPYDQGPAAHSFRRADALPIEPNEIMEIRFALFPTAALIRRGHRLRVAIAGADADTFHRYSEGRAETFTIHSGGKRVSGVELWMRRWMNP